MAGKKARTGAFTAVELLVSVFLILLLAVLLRTVISGAIVESKKSRCIGRQRNLHHAILAYGVDHAGRYPLWTSAPPDAGKNWHRTIWSYLSPSGTYSNWGGANSLELYRCPANPSTTSAISYAMNENLKDKRVPGGRARVLILIDQYGSHLVTGLKTSLDQRIKGWHREKNVVTFVDGHVEMLPRSGIPDQTGDAAFWGVSNN